jgi:hypothetical protein
MKITKVQKTPISINDIVREIYRFKELGFKYLVIFVNSTGLKHLEDLCEIPKKKREKPPIFFMGYPIVRCINLEHEDIIIGGS